MKGPLLSIDHCTMQFGGLTAIADFQFHLQDNELIGIIGPNGAGKTTLFNLITGVYRPTKGALRFLGTDLTPLKTHAINRLGIARTFQNIRLFGGLTVEENVVVAMHRSMQTTFWGISVGSQRALLEGGELKRQTEQMLKEFELFEQRQKKANELPYGQQRKLEIVRALATGPKLLLLDEPAAGMNTREKQDLTHLIERLQSERHLAMILIEHDMHVVMKLCPKLVVLDYGVTIATGTPDEIRKDPKVIEAYLGKGEVTT